jgi:hypothetical protein
MCQEGSRALKKAGSNNSRVIRPGRYSHASTAGQRTVEGHTCSWYTSTTHKLRSVSASVRHDWSHAPAVVGFRQHNVGPGPALPSTVPTQPVSTRINHTRAFVCAWHLGDATEVMQTFLTSAANTRLLRTLILTSVFFGYIRSTEPTDRYTCARAADNSGSTPHFRRTISKTVSVAAEMYLT